ncbi:MAG: hypothetical protein V1773_17695 [bacterium]
MKAVICVYTEGNENKAAVLTHENDVIKILKVVSTANPPANFTSNDSPVQDGRVIIEDSGEDISFDGLETDSVKDDFVTSSVSNIEIIASSLKEFKLKNFDFIAVASEPAIEYHYYDREKIEDKKNIISNLIEDIRVTKNINIGSDSIDYIELSDKQYLSVYLDTEVPVVNFINSVANRNKKRFYKIAAIKSGEIALANLVSKSTKFFPEDYTLIIYTGKDYSQLIFLEGQKLVHIGATLDIGTKNLHTYDVYFSKILLEMENGGIPRLDNVVLCGEDNSENLLLSFYGTFPEANVTGLKFDLFDSTLLATDAIENLGAYSILLAAGFEYFEELENKGKGISILPRNIKENQKFFQFSWHSYVMLPILFAATFYFTFKILSNYKTTDELNYEYENLVKMEKENESITAQINPLYQRIAGFDKTQTLLDSAMTGTEIWNTEIEKISSFMERRRNFWFTKIESKDDQNIIINGITLSRPVITKFVDQNSTAVLQNVIHEPIREKTAYSFIINYTITKDTTR